MLKVQVNGQVFYQVGDSMYLTADLVLEKVQMEMKKNGEEDRTGGALYVYVSDSPTEGRRLYHDICGLARPRIGFITGDGAWSRYQNNAREKALRLMWKHKTFGHLTSRESANEEAGEYGGAVILTGVSDAGLGDDLTILISFSGFPPDYDEMLCYLVAERMGWASTGKINSTVLNLASRGMANWPFLRMRGMSI